MSSGLYNQLRPVISQLADDISSTNERLAQVTQVDSGGPQTIDIDTSGAVRYENSSINSLHNVTESSGYSVLWLPITISGEYTVVFDKKSQSAALVYQNITGRSDITSVNYVSKLDTVETGRKTGTIEAGKHLVCVAWYPDYTITVTCTTDSGEEVIILKQALGLTEQMRTEVNAVVEDAVTDTIDERMSRVVSFEDVPETLELVPNEYVDGTGAFKPYSGWSRTTYVDVGNADKITTISTASSQYAFSYDESKNPIGSKWTVPAGTTEIALRESTRYIVISGTNSMMQTLAVFADAKKTILNNALALTPTMTDEVEEMIEGYVQEVRDTVIQPTAYLMKTQIPNYYFARNETPLDKHDIGYLDDRINAIPDGYHFMFVTDTHWNDNAKQSTKLISYVRDRIGAKFVLFGGDILTAHSSEAEAYRWLCDFTFDFKNAFGSNFLPVVGNHDLNAAGTTEHMLMYSDLVPLFTQGCDNRFHYCDYYDERIDSMASSKGMTAEQVAELKQYFRTCYYVDDAEGKTRFIIYNTGAGEGGSGITTFIDSYISGSFEELLIIEWLYDVLMHTPTGYNVILSTHIPGDFSWSSDGGTFLSSIRCKFAAVVAGVKARRNVTVYLPNSLSDYSWWGGESTMYFDYTNAPEVGIVAVIGGHTHVDKFGRYGFTQTTFNSSNFGSLQSSVNALAETCYQSSDEYVSGSKFMYEVPVILSQHDAYTKNGGPYSYTMELGTITEQVVDVVTITPEGNIALTRIGAGNDRFLTIE